MTYDFAKEALPWAVVAYGLGAFLAGYLIGSARTFAFLGYGSERLGTLLATMQPWFGHWQDALAYYRRKGR